MKINSKKLCTISQNVLSKHKAENIVTIDMKDKSTIADYMIVCSGTSSRHVIALSNYLRAEFKKEHLNTLSTEGKKAGDWVLVDAGDVIIHLFRNEVREYYNLEKMWDYEINENILLKN
tara:strand:- start:824 stop:1180 length:357 start_codon:yes stop_codon:yes gene_type:complete